MIADAAMGDDPFELPEEFFTEDGDLDIQAGMRHLVELGLIYNDNPELPSYGQELKEYSPGAYRFLNSFYAARTRSIMDDLIEKGMVEFFFENGEERYRFTSRGAELQHYFERMNIFKNDEDM